ncbi:hypothetical protein [Microbulbifer sp. JMSA003]|uniref:hypothetical protein n=1 Tax=Microbulbifer sp. JMSA003 TaxID=3243369 RepID=UPI00403948E2
MGNLIFGTTTIEGRTFDDIKVQTSKAGVPRPIIFGKVLPVIGNIIATTAPKIVKKKEKQKSGKGGGSTEVENEEVYRTYAIRICEGPITGISRVWRNNELVYDRDNRDPIQIINNNAFLRLAEFFLGGFDQQPSAVMQAAFGVSEVHAYRGTCYMVIDNENLTSSGGAIPQFAFEVERAEGLALTSKPYALESQEALSPGYQAMDAASMAAEIERLSPAYRGFAANLRTILKTAGDQLEVMAPAYSGFSAQLRTIKKDAGVQQEAMAPAYSGFSAQLRTAGIFYTESPETFAPAYAGFAALLE